MKNIVCRICSTNYMSSYKGDNPKCRKCLEIARVMGLEREWFKDEITTLKQSIQRKNGIINDKDMEINRLTGIINKLNESNSRLQRDIRRMT